MRAAVVPLLCLTLAACGPTASEVRAAKASAYKTEFANVWNAVVDEVKEDYPRFKVESPIRGTVLTDWHLVERTGGYDDMSGVSVQSTHSPTQTNTGTGNPADPNGPTAAHGAKFFRIAVWIGGGPHGPWTVEVDGEAAEYKPGMTLIVPFKHGMPDEPPWVQVRIDKIYAKIYRRLKKYAIVREAKVEAPKARVIDASAWANLPADAAQVVAQVNDVAAGDDPHGLRAFMVDDFTWSLGGAPSADQALTVWSADTTILVQLRKTLAAGCDAAGDGVIGCPAAAGAAGAWRAEFKKIGATWKFTSFVQAE